MSAKELGINSKLVHGGYHPDSTGAINVPIYQNSTFAFRDAAHGATLFAGKEKGYIYTRIGNPTIAAFEESVASLENGVGGIATSSGLGAVNTLYMALLGQGAHMVSTAAVYGPSRGLMEKHFARFGTEATFVDTSDLENLRKAMRPSTRLVYVESPSNPAMQVTDIPGAAAIARAHGSLLAVDNTFASPYLQRPLDLGADVVLHSITKFINGHADVVGGVLVAKDGAVHARLRDVMVTTGCNMDPHQAYLVLRGLKTLGLRVERAREGAFAAYKDRDVELVGYTTCGGCPGGNIEYAPEEMKKNGAEVVHLATGMLVGYPPCPHIEAFRRFIPEKYGMEVVVGTHPIPQKYYLTHAQLGTWQAVEWKPLLKPTLADEATRLAYD